MRGKGGLYLDGAIQAYPQHIGKPAAVMLMGGDESTMEACQSLMKVFGTVFHMGNSVSAPAALDQASITYALLSNMALAQGLHMAAKGGVPPEVFFKMLGKRIPVDVSQEVLDGYVKGDFSITDAPMKEWLPALQKQTNGGINAEMLLPVQRKRPQRQGRPTTSTNPSV